MVPVFDYRLPGPALREHVRLFQIVGCTFPAALAVLPAKAYWPRAENCLSFFPRDPEQVEYGFNGQRLASPPVRLYGQHTVATNRHVGRDFMVFQIVFQPGALFQLTGLSAAELTNTFLDAEQVFPPEIKWVSERLRNVAHYLDMIPLVEEFLLRLIRHTRPGFRSVDKVSRYLLHHPAHVSLDWLADQACLSQRQFYRQFVERQGISPKLFARVARFEQAMRRKNALPLQDWLTVALDLGYYDYQHLVRDFRQFTGLTPNAFWQRDSLSPERAFGMAET
ncbi:MAG: AraC family transcriptional regulator [Hymenobacter sp.]|nr:AraC family transcriptional regulator [Hymenobacter sp.]